MCPGVVYGLRFGGFKLGDIVLESFDRAVEVVNADLATQKEALVAGAGFFVTVLGQAPGGGVGGVTLREGHDHLGLTYSPGVEPAEVRAASVLADVQEIAEKVRAARPKDGEERTPFDYWLGFALPHIAESLAGKEAERIGGFDLGPAARLSDERAARIFAEAVAGEEAGTRALIIFGRAQARAILRRQRRALLALADALLEHGDLSGEQVDAIIIDAATAEHREREQRRRRAWRKIEASAYEAGHPRETAPRWQDK